MGPSVYESIVWMCAFHGCGLCSDVQGFALGVNKPSEKGQIVNTLGLASHILSLLNLLCFLPLKI